VANVVVGIPCRYHWFRGVAIQNVKYIQFFLSIKITMILSIKVDLVFFKKDVIQKIFEIFLFPNIGMLNE
jgi:hypothetical protein